MTKPPTKTALLILTLAAIGWWTFVETTVAAVPEPPKQARIAQAPVPWTDADLQAVTLQAEAYFARTTGRTTGCTVRNWTQLATPPPLSAAGTVAWAGGPCDAWYMPEILTYTPANFCAIVTHEAGHWLGFRHDDNGDALDGAPPIMDYDTMYSVEVPECGVPQVDVAALAQADEAAEVAFADRVARRCIKLDKRAAKAKRRYAKRVWRGRANRCWNRWDRVSAL